MISIFMFLENYKKLDFLYFLQYLFINFIIQSHMQFFLIHCVTVASQSVTSDGFSETQSRTGDHFSETQSVTVDHFSETQSVTIDRFSETQSGNIAYLDKTQSVTVDHSCKTCSTRISAISAHLKLKMS